MDNMPSFAALIWIFSSGFQILPWYVQWTKRLYSLRSFGQLVRISDPLAFVQSKHRNPSLAAQVYVFCFLFVYTNKLVTQYKTKNPDVNIRVSFCDLVRIQT